MLNACSAAAALTLPFLLRSTAFMDAFNFHVGGFISKRVFRIFVSGTFRPSMMDFVQKVETVCPGQIKVSHIFLILFLFCVPRCFSLHFSIFSYHLKSTHYSYSSCLPRLPLLLLLLIPLIILIFRLMIIFL